VNPDERELLRAAKAFREDFHWGIPARKVARKKVAPTPRVLVELGKLHAVEYKTHKKGDGPSVYHHDFGEETGRRPTLAMDAENGSLHVVGGEYRVTDRGIEN